MIRLRLDSNMFLPFKFQSPFSAHPHIWLTQVSKALKNRLSIPWRNIFDVRKHIIIGAKISRSIPTTPCSVLVWELWVTERGRLKDWSVPHYCRHLQSRHSGTPSPRTWSPSSSTSPTSWSSYLVCACAGETITVLQTLRVGEPTTAPYCSCLVSN